jgi:hypothetical protein
MASVEHKGDATTTVRNGEMGAGEDDLHHVKALEQVVASARAGAESEQRMTLMQGIRLYPKAIMWSLLISTCIVMEGFDMALVNTMCSLPVLHEKLSISKLTWTFRWVCAME